jgi:hypothetical protein
MNRTADPTNAASGRQLRLRAGDLTGSTRADLIARAIVG